MRNKPECNDEVFDIKAERAIDAQVEADEVSKEQYELSRRYAPEGFDFYAKYEYLDCNDKAEGGAA